MKFIFAKNTLMESIPRYNFCKNKYGEELLIDIVSLKSISKYICTTPVHTLSYFDITVITNGNGSITIDGSRYELRHGDVIFSRPQEVRQWDTNNYPEGYAIIFEEDFLLSFFNDTSFINELSFFNINRVSAIINISHIYEKISNLINSLINEINIYENKDKHILRALLYEFLTILNREYINRYSIDNISHNNRYVDEFLKLADSNFVSIHDTKYYANKLYALFSIL